MITLEMLKKEGTTGANVITYLRFVLSFCPAAIFFDGWNVVQLRWAATIMFCFAALTDLADGWCARKFNQVTDLGKLMDPIVDKVLVLVTLSAIYLVTQDIIILGMTIIIALREGSVTVLRFFASRQGIIISANKWGKYKTVSQVVTILFILLPITNIIMYYAKNIMIGFTVWITILSGMVYFVSYFKQNHPAASEK